MQDNTTSLSFFRVRFPHPPTELSANYSRPLNKVAAVAANAKRMRAKMATRDGAILRVRAALGVYGGKKFVPVRYSITWYYKGVEPDVDNVVSRCKHLLDGAAKAMGIDDRSLELGTVERVHTKEYGVAGNVDIAFEGEWKGGDA